MSAYARGRVLEAAGGLLITRAGLSFAGFRRWKAAVEWLTPATAAPGNGPAGLDVEFARAMERWQAAAARHLPFSTNCLDCSLSLWWLLRRRGIAADLCIGGRKENEQFEAHAWVEIGGVEILDVSDGRGDFAAFAGHVTAMETSAL